MTREQIVNMAQSQVGYHEKVTGTPVEQLYPFRNNYDGADNWTKFHHDISVTQGADWCGYFCYWVFYQILGKSFLKTDTFLHGISGKGGFVDTWETAFASAGYYFPKGTYIPQPGDIVIFSDNNYTWSHVEIVVDVSEWPNWVTTVGGNTKNPDEGGDQSRGMYVALRRRSVTATSGFWIRGFCAVDAAEGSMGGTIILKRKRIGTAFG